MPAPYDYTIQAVNPLQSFLQGVQTVDTLQKREQEIAAQKAAQQQLQQRQALMNQFQTKAAEGKLQVSDFDTLLLIDPANHKAWSERAAQLSTEKKDAAFNTLSPVYAALYNKQPEVAKARLQTQLVAAENAQDAPRAAQIKAALQLIETPEGQQAALLDAGTTMFGLQPERMKALQETLNTQASADATRREALAKAKKLEREAESGTVEQYEILSRGQVSALGLPSNSTYQRDKTTGKISAIGSGGVTVNLPSQVQVGTIPQGYQLTYDAKGRPLSMEPVPGSPAAKQAADAAKKLKEGAESRISQSSIVLEDIGKLKNLVKESKLFSPVTGPAGEMVSRAGILKAGSKRASAENLVTTITANIGFDQLAKMRAESPTGGALGNVTERELDALQKVMGSISLEQEPKQLQANLDRLGVLYKTIMAKASAYPNAAEYGFVDAATTQTQPSVSPVSVTAPTTGQAMPPGFRLIK
jgi:hypothetical protein